MAGSLSENTSYIESADDFYGKQEFHLDHADDFNKMGSLYNKRLNQILNKNYENISGQNAGKRLLKKVIRDGNKIQFGHYLRYLVDNGIINSNNNYDDIDQIGDLQDKLRGLKEQTENLGNRDFHISEGRIGGYKFDGKNNFEYIGNNKHIIKINFNKTDKSRIGKFKFKVTKRKQIEIGIKYNGTNLIEYYRGNSFNENDFLGETIISHKKEYIEERNKSYNKIYGEKYLLKKQKFYNEKTNISMNKYQHYKKGYESINIHSRTKNYIQSSTEEVYLKKLGVYLTLKFNNNNQ